MLAVATVPLFMELLGLGPAVFRASEYLQSDGPSFAFKLGGIIAPIGFLAAAFLAVAPDRRHRRAGQLLCLAYTVVLFSTATRALGMLPLLWLLLVEGLGVGGKPSRRAVRAIGMFFLTYLGFATALVARGLDNHGLIPYVTYFAHHPTAVFLAPAMLSENLLFGYPLTSFVVHVAPAVTQHDITTSLNPLPGSMTDWASIAPLLRAHPFIPFNTIGELFRFSPAVGLIYFAFSGFMFQYAAAALMSTGSPRLRLTVRAGSARRRSVLHGHHARIQHPRGEPDALAGAAARRRDGGLAPGPDRPSQVDLATKLFGHTLISYFQHVSR